MAFLGGDRRELVVADTMASLGAQVRAVGLPWPDPVSYTANSLEETVAWAQVVVAPVGGTDEVGHIAYSIVPPGEFPGPRLTEDVVSRMRPGTLLLIGSARPFLERLCHIYAVRLVAYRDWDEFAIPNAVPSSEGAIAMAMQASDVTIHGSVCVVLGYGRTASVLAHQLRGMGARTAVVARQAAERARARAHGHEAWDFPQLEELLPQADHVFNTVPALVLTEERLRLLPPTAVVIDVASAPGGTDFSAAKRLGRYARLAPGLPGVVAPRTAGRIEADMILEILRRERLPSE
jgi:dipicolinate synthase subunit A